MNQPLVSTKKMDWISVDCNENRQKKPCDYPVIENGKISERMAHSYFPMRIGQYVDYHCRNGYLAPNGGRVVRIYCSKGGWNPEPKCLKTCFVTHLENGYFRYNRYTYTEGERIQYVCNQDYRTESAGGEVTCTKNGWSPFPRCIRKTIECETPILPNGSISPRKDKYSNGDVVKFFCEKKYKRVGPASAQCYYFGWSPSPPACKERPCGSIPAVANAAFEGRSKEKYEPGETIRYQCHEGFKATGLPEIFCRRGTWSTPPICEDVTCEPPPEIAGGKVQGVKKPRYLPGETAHYQCWQGFQMTGASTVTCQNGTWTEQPQCKGEFSLSLSPCSRLSVKTALKLAQWHLDCNLSVLQIYFLRMPNVRRVRNCAVCSLEVLPTWSSEEFVASPLLQLNFSGFLSNLLSGKGRKCVPPPDIENGDILSFPLPEYDQGQIVKYKCASFYILKGPEQITCIDGQWTNPPVCLAACTASEEDMDRNNIELRWRGERKLYSTSGDFIEFDCKIGYVQDPASSPFRVQCMDGTLEYPRCKPGSKSPPLCHCFVPVSFSSASLLQPQLCPLCAAPLWLCPALVCVEAGVNAHCTPSHASPAGNLCLPPPTISPSRNYSDIAEGYEMGFCLSSSAMCVDTGGDRCSRDAAQGNK
uniref:Sushi domain-containing protein n=1 Tax=Anas platyrhynchos TaxID=8839 RepID=A0A8B9TB87_ANAPL